MQVVIIYPLFWAHTLGVYAAKKWWQIVKMVLQMREFKTKKLQTNKKEDVWQWTFVNLYFMM